MSSVSRGVMLAPAWYSTNTQFTNIPSYLYILKELCGFTTISVVMVAKWLAHLTALLEVPGVDPILAKLFCLLICCFNFVGSKILSGMPVAMRVYIFYVLSTL